MINTYPKFVSETCDILARRGRCYIVTDRGRYMIQFDSELRIVKLYDLSEKFNPRNYRIFKNFRTMFMSLNSVIRGVR